VISLPYIFSLLREKSEERKDKKIYVTARSVPKTGEERY